MDYIEQIFNRLNLQQIRCFLRNGVECYNVSDQSYIDREKEAWGILKETLKELLSDDDLIEKVSNAVSAYAGVSDNIHMEVGMRCGFTLATQLGKE